MKVVTAEFSDGFHDTLLTCMRVYEVHVADRFRIFRNPSLDKTTLYGLSKASEAVRCEIAHPAERGEIPIDPKINAEINRRLADATHAGCPGLQ